jgi:dTDP-4-amino-4,6-dideoxygalactose transaminase
VRPGVRHVFHQYTIRVPDSRDEAVEKLRAEGIGVGIYYPIPIHRQPLYRRLGYDDTLPVTEQAAGEVLSLPVHPSLSREDLDRIVKAVEALR